jgi:hypothetical protein
MNSSTAAVAPAQPYPGAAPAALHGLGVELAVVVVLAAVAGGLERLLRPGRRHR